MYYICTYLIWTTWLGEEEPPDVEDPIHKLKEAIGKAMPEQIAHFHQSCQVYEQVKTSK